VSSPSIMPSADWFTAALACGRACRIKRHMTGLTH
jgi:hypothetical protein